MDEEIEEVVARERGPKSGKQIQEAFDLWAEKNPEVMRQILRHAVELKRSGCRRISTKYLIEWARYELKHGINGVDEYSINSDFSAPLARWLIKTWEPLAPLIETRRSKVDEVSA